MAVVIIPAYRTDGALVEVVNELQREKLVEKRNMQVIVVDDGSGDEYRDVFDEVSEECIVLHHRENRGKGAAIKTALTYVKKEIWEYDTIGIMDADGQHRPEDMMRLLDFSKEHRQALCLGVRKVGKDMPLRSRLGNGITRKVFRLVSGTAVSDTQTGLRAFDIRLLPDLLAVSGDRYEYEMNVLLTCARKHIDIEEMEIETIYHDRENSCSHFNSVRDSFRIYKDIIKFTLSSMSSFLLDYVIFSVLMLVLPHTGIMIMAGNIAARAVSAFYNYSMNCRHVFHTGRKVSTALEYFALAAVILILNNIILGFFTGIMQISVYPAKLMTECVLFIISWMVQRQIIFRKNRHIGGKIDFGLK